MLLSFIDISTSFFLFFGQAQASFFKSISFSEVYFAELFIFYSPATSGINERDDEVPTTTAVSFSMSNSQPLSRRTRLLKGDSQSGAYGLGDGSYRPSSVDGG